MLTLTDEELINVHGGTSVYIAPTYALFTKFCKFLSNFIKSLQR